MPAITRTLETLDLPAALAIAQAALERGRALNLNICVCVVDAVGLPLVALRMPAAPLQSTDMAADKAYTAASFKRPTLVWRTLFAERDPSVRESLMQRPRFVASAGGRPVLVDGHCVGAVGISGGLEAQDDDCAQAGIAALETFASGATH